MEITFIANAVALILMASASPVPEVFFLGRRSRHHFNPKLGDVKRPIHSKAQSSKVRVTHMPLPRRC